MKKTEQEMTQWILHPLLGLVLELHIDSSHNCLINSNNSHPSQHLEQLFDSMIQTEIKDGRGLHQLLQGIQNRGYNIFQLGIFP